jgi:hypothetical protein
VDTSLYIEVIDLIEDIYSRKRVLEPTSAALDFGVNPPLFFTIRVSVVDDLQTRYWVDSLLTYFSGVGTSLLNAVLTSY